MRHLGGLRLSSAVSERSRQILCRRVAARLSALICPEAALPEPATLNLRAAPSQMLLPPQFRIVLNGQGRGVSGAGDAYCCGVRCESGRVQRAGRADKRSCAEEALCRLGGELPDHGRRAVADDWVA